VSAAQLRGIQFARIVAVAGPAGAAEDKPEMPNKKRTHYVCQNCGYETPRWLGRCPECGQWNTLVEEAQEPEGAVAAAGRGEVRPLPLDEIEDLEAARLATGFAELDRVLGGGLVPGSLVLLGGDPGIGKSTLTLQVSNSLAGSGHRVLYVSGEESARQVKLRASRLGAGGRGLYVLAETEMGAVKRAIQELNPQLVVIDSIQTMYLPELSSAPGSVSQVREAAGQLLRVAKERGVTVIIVGHVTKAGALAGPRLLEHMMDTVLYFEGERHLAYRVLRATKNRFGSNSEIGIFEMEATGLVEVANPSQIFLADRPAGVAGTVVVASLEGTRPLLVELQALVAPTPFGLPRRMVGGLDVNRSLLVLAVLERRAGLALGTQDVYLKVAGGLRLDEPAVDLGVALAVASSFHDLPLPEKMVVMGEVGLAGEIRPVGRLEQRLKEAQRLGFELALLPASSGRLKDVPGIKSMRARDIREALQLALGR